MPPSRIYKGTTLVYERPDKAVFTAMLPGLATGTRIQLFRAANIRSSEEISTTSLRGVNLSGSRGTIVGGPRTGIQNSIWYDINFDTGFDGWCVSDNYTVITDNTPQTTPSTFSVGDTIRLFRRSNVRSTAAIANNLLRVADANETGTVTAGPTRTGTINWYRIDFATGADGWVASDNYIKVAATGGGVIPTGGGGPTPTGPANFTVSNSAQLLAAMVDSTRSNAVQVIQMQAGDYTNLVRNNALVKPGARTFIRAQNPNQGNNARSRFFNANNTEFRGLNGFTFDGIVWESTGKDAQGFPDANTKAVNAVDCSNLTFRNCTIRGSHRAFAFHDVTNLTVEWCEFTRIGMDSLSCFGTHTNIQVLNNHFHNMDIDFRRAQSDQPNRHPDACSVQGGGTRGVLISGNSFFGPNSYWQPIFCPNATVRNDGDFEANHNANYIIRKNWMVSRHTNGLLVGGARNVTVEDNVSRILNVATPWTVTMGDSLGLGQPKIVLEGRVEGVVRRNVSEFPVSFRNNTNQNLVDITAHVVSATATPAALPRPEPCGPYNF